MAARFQATKQRVLNRGVAPDSFLEELVNWGRVANPLLFSPNKSFDIYNKIKPELGPWKSELHRKAAMLEVLRVLAGFESSWDWTEGVDTSRLGADTPENAEAGAWQVSYDARKLSSDLANLLADARIVNAIDFQRTMKFDRAMAMNFEATLLRADVTNPKRLHNGPLYKGDERLHIRKSLRGQEHSIYQWLRRDAVLEFEKLLA